MLDLVLFGTEGTITPRRPGVVTKTANDVFGWGAAITTLGTLGYLTTKFGRWSDPTTQKWVEDFSEKAVQIGFPMMLVSLIVRSVTSIEG